MNTVYFAVEGGYANWMRSLQLESDGSYEAVFGDEVVSGSTTPEQVRQIFDLLERSGLFDQSRIFEAQGADLQRYELQADDATVVMFDTSIPAALSGAVELLDELLLAAGHPE